MSLFPPRCCSSHPLAAQGPRVRCELPVGHEDGCWHEGSRDGGRWAWWGAGCPLERPRIAREVAA